MPSYAIRVLVSVWLHVHIHVCVPQNSGKQGSNLPKIVAMDF